MDNKVVSLAITLAISTIVLAAVFVPVLNGYTDEKLTYENKGATYAEFDNKAHTIIVDSNGIKTDNEDYQPLPDTSAYGSAMLIGAPNFIRLSSNGQIREYLNLSGTYTSRVVGDIRAAPVTITIKANGDGTIESDGYVARNFDGTFAIPTVKGGYSLTYSPKVLEDSRIIGAGVSTIDGMTYTLHFDGTPDGITSVFDHPPTDAVSIQINKHKVVKNLYQIDNIAITTQYGELDPVELNYSYFLAPKNIEYDNPDKLPGNATAIVLAIPIIILAALLVYAVGAVRRDD